jgi:uncharacterized caspase-like protein
MLPLKYLALMAVILLAPDLAFSARVALVVGNADYRSVSRLANPLNDADAMADALERLGFTVSLASNTSKSELERLLADFSEKAVSADMSVVFFAGHGIEVAGENYLIPVDATLKSDTRIKFETVALNDILSALGGGRGIKLILLDACRDNPFVASMGGSKARSVVRGLAKVEALDGIYVSYAAAAGTTASDGVGKHSPYTEALLATIEEPGLELNFLFRKVAGYVRRKTGGAQTPFEYGRLPDERVYLKSPEEEKSEPAKASCSEAGEHWRAIENKASRQLFEAHLEHFGQCAYAPLAAQALRKLDAGAVGKPPSGLAADASVTGSESTTAVEASVKDKAEAAPVETALAVAEDATPDLDLVSLARGIQESLNRLGCTPGSVDGQWGRQSRRAMERFNRFASLSLDAQEPSLEALATMKERTERVCPLECAPTEQVVGDRCERKSCRTGLVLDKRGRCVAEAASSRTKVKSERRAHDPSECFFVGQQKLCP